MRAGLVAIRDADAALLARWHDLAERAAEPNPFFAPGMALAAARELPGGDADRLVTVMDGRELVFALPVRPARHYRRIPVRTVRAWGHPYAFLDSPLVAGDPARCWEAALGALRGTGARWLACDRLPADGPARDGLDAVAGGVVLAGHERAIVRRRPRPDYLDGRLSAQRRKRLRRSQKRLAEALGSAPALRDRARDDLAGALDRFLALELAGWKGRAGTALAARPADAVFFRAAMGAAHEAGRAQVWELAADGAPVASLCAVVAGRGVFHLKIAYDEAHAAHSPGLQLEVAILEEAFHADPAVDWIDSCTDGGESPSTLLYPDRRVMETVLVPLGGDGARALATLTRRGLDGRNRLRAAMQRSRDGVSRPATAGSAPPRRRPPACRGRRRRRRERGRTARPDRAAGPTCAWWPPRTRPSRPRRRRPVRGGRCTVRIEGEGQRRHAARPTLQPRVGHAL